jgi:anti-sigma regulatory factor (Ser/Thr protein kinase)
MSTEDLPNPGDAIRAAPPTVVNEGSITWPEGTSPLVNGPPGVLGPVSMTLHPHAKSVASARRFVTAVLDEIVDDARRRDIELLVSELVTNGVLHAATTMELVVCVDADNGTVRVELVDEVHAAPYVRPEPGADGGFGLRIIAGLAQDWGVDQHDRGKTVWFEI